MVTAPTASLPTVNRCSSGIMPTTKRKTRSLRLRASGCVLTVRGSKRINFCFLFFQSSPRSCAEMNTTVLLRLLLPQTVNVNYNPPCQMRGSTTSKAINQSLLLLLSLPRGVLNGMFSRPVARPKRNKHWRDLLVHRVERVLVGSNRLRERCGCHKEKSQHHRAFVPPINCNEKNK